MPGRFSWESGPYKTPARFLIWVAKTLDARQASQAILTTYSKSRRFRRPRSLPRIPRQFSNSASAMPEHTDKLRRLVAVFQLIAVSRSSPQEFDSQAGLSPSEELQKRSRSAAMLAVIGGLALGAVALFYLFGRGPAPSIFRADSEVTASPAAGGLPPGAPGICD